MPKTGGGGGGPWAGRRVLELGDEVGAYCGKLFADLGADVIKVEKPGGDDSRWRPPFWHHKPDAKDSLAFIYMNANKRSVTLDLASESGRELLRRLATTADVLVESFPVGHLASLDLGYASLSRGNKGLIMTSITPFGQTGPRCRYKGSDMVAYATGGLMYLTGYADKPPLRLPGSMIYVIASLHAAAASAMAIVSRNATGLGRHIDISMQEAVASFSTLVGVARFLEDKVHVDRDLVNNPVGAPSGYFPCKDGYVSISIGRAWMWPLLAKWIHEVTGNDQVLLPRFQVSRERLLTIELVNLWVEELTTQFTVEELYQEGQKRRIAVAPVSTPQQVVGSVQLAARDFFVTIGQAQGRLKSPGIPYRFSESEPKPSWIVPAPGEHNRDILCGELGLSEKELARDSVL